MKNVETKIMEVQIKTKNKEDNLYNILTKDEHESYKNWMYNVGFSIKGKEVEELINEWVIEEKPEIKETIEKHKNNKKGIIPQEVSVIDALFNSPSDEDIKKQLIEQYKEVIDSDKIIEYLI